jgi:hypothetical protein
MNMLKIFGEEYYIDIDLVNIMCQIPTKNSSDEDSDNKTNEMNLNIPVYNVINMCCESLLSEYEESDQSLGFLSEAQTSISFKFAFNTLLHNKILKTKEEDE